MKIIVLILVFMTSLFANEALEKVSLQLLWKYQFEFAGFIAAKEKGFYKEVGLDVDLIELNASQNFMKNINDGTMEFGVSDSALILEAMKGEPVVAMMAVFQDSPYILMGLKSSNIKVIEDLNDKKLALQDSIAGVSIKAMLESRQVQYIKKPIGFTLDKLINKEIDFMTAYISNEPYIAQEMGLDIVTFDPKIYGFEDYGDILFTSKALLQKRPDLVAKMYDASKQGWEYAFSHIDEMVELIYKKYNTLNKTKEALKYEANVLKDLSGYGKNFGELKIEKLQSISQVFSFMLKGKYDLDNLDNLIYKETKSEIELTQEELTYLKNKKISICVHPDLYPLEFIKDGQHKGISADYLQFLTKDYPFNFELIPAKSDKEVYQSVLTSKCDLKPLVLHKYSNTLEYLGETTIINSDNLVLITTNNKPFINSWHLLKDKKIAVRYEIYKNFLNENYPLLDITVIEDIQEVIKQLKNGDLFGFLEMSLYANTIVQKYGFNALKVNTKLSPHNLKGAIGISKKEPQLLTIMNKLIKAVPKNEIDNIKTRWSIQIYHHIVDYALIWKVVLISLFIILLVLYWTFKYKREVKKRKAAEQNLQKLNLLLEGKVKTEVEKNKQHQLIMLQQSRHAQMGEMISMIAHQWRQPLSAISVTSALIELKAQMNSLDSDMAQQKAKDISNYAQHLSHTIDDFRDFFKPNKELKETSYDELVTSVLGIIEVSISNQNIQLHQALNCYNRFTTYPKELKQVLLNLIKNAEDVLLEKEIKSPYIKIETYQKDNKHILEVSDNGGGIPEEIMDNIFDPYFSTKQDKNGTGLGLYMSKTIIEEHCNGELSVKNSRDGAVFKIVLKDKL